jgi:UDP-2,4-diacetamido-2,4,6-trideoxy-beta-L-altropyranose hydrolase
LKKAAFRVEADRKTGMGHLVRCLALAQMIGSEFEIVFAIHQPGPEVKELLKRDAVSFEDVPAPDDLSFSADKDLVILDGYWFTEDFVQALAKKCKVIQVDDIPASAYYAHVILNHALGLDYSKSELNGATLLTGSDYAMLRKEFLAGDDPNASNQRTSVAISFGGSDPANATALVLNILISLVGPEMMIEVIAGPLYRDLKELNQLAERNKNVIIHHALPAKSIAEILQSSTLFIGPASTMIYEALAMETPSACIVTADNQSAMYKGLIDAHAVTGLGNIADQDGLKKKLTALIGGGLEKMRHEKKKLIDGKSPRRIRTAIAKLWS